MRRRVALDEAIVDAAALVAKAQHPLVLIGGDANRPGLAPKLPPRCTDCRFRSSTLRWAKARSTEIPPCLSAPRRCPRMIMFI